MIRGLPIAAFRHERHVQSMEHLTHHARGVALLTHNDPGALIPAGLGVHVAAVCLDLNDPAEAIRVALSQHDHQVPELFHDSARAAEVGPADASTLATLAPDRTCGAALAGALYAVMSFGQPDQVPRALEFASRAPHGNAVAATTGAFLGAAHGVEALPQSWVELLELGWVMDRLARDLAVQVRENQAGGGWKEHGCMDAIDPWWAQKYPGV
jgi:ADP-ribosylglycohydrolase